MNGPHLLQISAFNQYWSSISRNFSNSSASWSTAIFATSCTALVGLGAYRWSHAKQETQQHAMSDFDQKDNIMRTYAYVFGGFALTAASVATSHVSGLAMKILNHSSYIVPVTSLLSCGALAATLYTSKEHLQKKQLFWTIFNVAMGITLSPLGFLNKALLAQAAFISLGVGGILTLTAYMAPNKKFLRWEGPLITALSTLSLASAVATFFPRSAFAYGVDRASLYGGIAIFSLFFMASTQRLIENAEKQDDDTFDPINSSLGIYLDGLNIFVRILRILAENKKKEE